MPITPLQRVLVQRSFAQAANKADYMAEMLFQRLFELAPELIPLFKGDLQEHGRKLMRMLAITVSYLDDPETLNPMIQALGKRHTSYGVLENHYAPVGLALLWSLEKTLGRTAFNPDVREAWRAVYNTLAKLALSASIEATGEHLRLR